MICVYFWSEIAYRYEDLRQKDESDATVTYDPEDTLEVSQNEGGEEETGEGEELLDVEKDQVLMEHGRKKRKLEKDVRESFVLLVVFFLYQYGYISFPLL